MNDYLNFILNHWYTFFIVGDQTKEDDKIRRVIFVSGKHYYNLVKQRTTLGAKDVALVRLEGLSPFPTLNLQQEVAKYRNAKSKHQYHNCFACYIKMTMFLIDQSYLR